MPLQHLKQINPQHGRKLASMRCAEIASIPETKPLLHLTVYSYNVVLLILFCQAYKEDCHYFTSLGRDVRPQSWLPWPHRKPVIIMQRSIYTTHARLALIVAVASSTIRLLFDTVVGKQSWEQNTWPREKATLCTWGRGVCARRWILTHTSNATSWGASRRGCAGDIQCLQGAKVSISDTR